MRTRQAACSLSDGALARHPSGAVSGDATSAKTLAASVAWAPSPPNTRRDCAIFRSAAAGQDKPDQAKADNISIDEHLPSVVGVGRTWSNSAGRCETISGASGLLVTTAKLEWCE